MKPVLSPPKGCSLRWNWRWGAGGCRRRRLQFNAQLGECEVTMPNDVIQEQIRYYNARVAEYDE